MVKKSFFKECLRSIRGSFSRFLAIFLIVALGAGFLAGLLAATPDMRHTVSELYHDTNLYDLRIVGNLGLEDGDLAALSTVPGVAAVMPARTADRELSLPSGDTLVARFHSVSAWEGTDLSLINRGNLIDGRWPQSSDECVIEEGTALSQGALGIGQTLSLIPLEDEDPEDDETPEEPFTQQQFTVVGVVASGYYVSMLQRGSTSIGTGSLDCIVYVQDDVLNMEYYTDIYAVVEGSQSAEAFTEAYDDLITPVQTAVETLAETQMHVRADRLRADAQEELDEAKQELADKTAEGEQELADALKELEDGEQEYADGLIELEDGRKELEDAYRELKDAEAELPKALQELQDGEQEYADGLKKLEDGQAEIDKNQADLDQAYFDINDAKRELKAALELLKAGEDEMSSGKQQIDAAREQLADGKQQIDAAQTDLNRKEQLLEQGYQYGMMSEAVYKDGKEQIAAGQEQIDQQKELLASGQKELDDSLSALQAGAQALSSNWNTYNKALEEVEAAEVEYRWGVYRLQLAREELEKGRQELEDARIELDNGWKEYADGFTDLQHGWNDYNEGLLDLQDAEQELTDARIELDDGWKEYEDGKIELEDKVYEANQKIRDAQDQIDDIDEPEWYVLSRGESNEGYIYYESDTEKVSSIAKVFPVFFFLVAALVASTTMTRMIDEDRGTIGTLKALGYSNLSIAGKYLLYASLACLAGAALGLAAFLPLFPRVIAQAYSMMYNIPPIVGSDHTIFILISAGMILIAVLLSTLGALRGVLHDNAATLMRPKAPPAGKRILLERIGPLWRRMKFTHKVTARNLFRYKKRFFMTIIGIAGCTTLLVAGFGLRDSIADIVNIQFNELQNYNLTLTLKHEEDDTIDRDIRRILQDPTQITEYLTVHKESGAGVDPERDTKLQILVPSDCQRLADFHTFRDRITGEPVLFAEDGAILTEKAAKVLGVQVGGTFLLRNQDDVEAEIPVSGICENYVLGYVYLSESLYEQAFGAECTFDTVLAKTTELDQTGRDILASGLLESSNATGVSFSADTIETYDDMLASIDYIVILLIVAAAALAFVVLYNLTNINICERQKEIATLKVLGFYRREVSNYVFRETILLSLIGTAIGLVVGIGFHQFVVQTAEVDAVMFGRVVQPMSFLYSGALSIVFTMLVSLFMQKKLKDIDMVESLKAQE